MDTLVIGLDGGEWDVIDPMIERGELPHLAQLKNEGVSGDLQSITPPVSPPAWNSIQTGTNPSKHGIFNFSTFNEDYSRRSVNSSDRSADPFWTVMNNEGVTTGLFKIPFTYPPDDVDGFMITGFPTPNIVDDHTTPRSLTDQVGPVEELFEDWSLQQAGDYEAFLEDLIQVAERQTDLFLQLLQDYDTDFSMTVYDGSDRVQHFFWKYFDESHPRYTPDSPLAGAIEKYYETVDRGIGRILNATDENCDIVIISDHGFGPLSSDIYIDEWLVKEGFLSRRSESSGEKIIDDVLAATLKTGWHAVKRANLDDAVRSLLPASWFQFGSDIQDESHRDIIWGESQVFFTTLSGQSLFVNLKEDFEDGKVTQNQYDDVVEGVRKSLHSLHHPETGEELVEEVIRSDEAFDGWRVDQGPDLIVRTVPDHTLKGGRSDKLVRPSAQNDHDRSGDHRTNGIFLATGPSFSIGSVESASVLDIAPTLLYLQDSPIPQSMDGSVLAEALDDNVLDRREIRTTTQYGRSNNGGRQWTDDEETELENRLSNMGYLD